MTVKKCDKCGKEVKSYHLKLHSGNSLLDDYGFKKEAELCEACAISFRMWFNPPTPK